MGVWQGYPCVHVDVDIPCSLLPSSTQNTYAQNTPRLSNALKCVVQSTPFDTVAHLIPAQLTVCSWPRSYCGVFGGPAFPSPFFRCVGNIQKKLSGTLYFQDNTGKAPADTLPRAHRPPPTSSTLPNRPCALLIVTKIYANAADQTGVPGADRLSLSALAALAASLVLSG